MILDDNLRNEYQNLYDSCVVNPSKTVLVNGLANKIISNKARYEAVAAGLNIPWKIIGVIHNMECSLNFSCHLHNGDPLTARTKNEPPGRPVNGAPPFKWEDSAIDALIYQKFDQCKDWSIPGFLFLLESYNGWGYRQSHPLVLSPYLWSFSNHYTKGKFYADGKWSDTLVSEQCGAAVLLKQIDQLLKTAPGPVFKLSSTKIPYGEDLQAFLNKIPGIKLTVDGITGQKTSDAVNKVFGFELKNDKTS